MILSQGKPKKLFHVMSWNKVIFPFVFLRFSDLSGDIFFYQKKLVSFLIMSLSLVSPSTVKKVLIIFRCFQYQYSHKLLLYYKMCSLIGGICFKTPYLIIQKPFLV